MKRRLKVALAVMMAVLFLSSCAWWNPFRSPGQPEPQPPKDEGRRYQEEPTITLLIEETGEKKEVKIEDYLQGVVAAEMEPTWNREALAAQAILARSFTLQKMKEGKLKEIHGPGVDACTNIEHFQAYNADRINDNVVQAVKATRGQVATYDGEAIRAWFHANSGGKTATAEEGLNFKGEELPYIASVDDVEYDYRPWSATFSSSQVAAALSKMGKSLGGGLSSASISEKGPSGRALTVTINGQKVSAADLRLALGSTEMRSTLLTDIGVEGGRLVVKGRGYGHGVGMAQEGARALAEAGKKAIDIVNFYFKDVTVEQWWD